jgi:AraC-like DNA-binding protein
VRDESLPLERHPCIRASSVDETEEIYSKLITPVKVRRTDRNPYLLHSNCVAVGPLAVFAHRMGGGCEATVDAVQDIFSLSFPIGHASGVGRHAGVTTQHVEGVSGILLSPGRPVTCRLERGYRSLEVVVRREEVEASLAALGGEEQRQRLAFEPRVALACGGGKTLDRLVRWIVDQADDDQGLLASPLVAARLADAVLFAMLLGLPHNYSPDVTSATRAAEPRHVRRAAEFLAANAARPVRMAELTDAIGVSVRTLQIGFLKHRGVSPMAFLREQRLGLARTRLLGSSKCSITQVAYDCGFEHAGRFSVLYRARFGETPSQTLRRSS